MGESVAREGLRASAPIRVGSAAVLVVERVVVACSERGPAGAWTCAAAEPYAVVVREGGRTTALAVGAGAVSLERLRERIPGIDRALESA